MAFPSPDMYFRLRFSKEAAGWVSHKWYDPTCQELMDKQRGTPNEDERLKMVLEAQRIIVDQGPCVFLMTGRTIGAEWPHVRAYEAALNGRDYGGAYWQFEHVWLAK